MSTVFISSCTGAGFLVGAGLGAYSRRLVASVPPMFWMVKIVVPLVTALAFGDFAWRFGYQLNLLLYCALAALGVILGLIDLIDRRLPSALTYVGFGIVGPLLATSAIVDSRGPDLLRALAGMTILTTFYLVLALVSGGELGAGDVKLGGLLGLALGWLSWSTLLTATVLGWLAAAAVWLLMRLVGRKPRNSLMPMGPFLLIGALLTISTMPA